VSEVRYVVLYESGPDVLELAPVHMAAHVVHYEGFAARGLLVAIGTFEQPEVNGSMCVLTTREAAEEFVTAVLAQVSADGDKAEILNCGHPPPLLIRDGEVTALTPPEAGLPLGLASLSPQPREACAVPLKSGDRLLFYTDGISEARDKQGTFYPIERSGALLGLADLGLALDMLVEDVIGHVGHALQDDAAILLIGCQRQPPEYG